MNEKSLMRQLQTADNSKLAFRIVELEKALGELERYHVFTSLESSRRQLKMTEEAQSVDEQR